MLFSIDCVSDKLAMQIAKEVSKKLKIPIISSPFDYLSREKMELGGNPSSYISLFGYQNIREHRAGEENAIVVNGFVSALGHLRANSKAPLKLLKFFYEFSRKRIRDYGERIFIPSGSSSRFEETLDLMIQKTYRDFTVTSFISDNADDIAGKFSGKILHLESVNPVEPKKKEPVPVTPKKSIIKGNLEIQS